MPLYLRHAPQEHDAGFPGLPLAYLTIRPSLGLLRKESSIVHPTASPIQGPCAAEPLQRAIGRPAAKEGRPVMAAFSLWLLFRPLRHAPRSPGRSSRLHVLLQLRQIDVD